MDNQQFVTNISDNMNQQDDVQFLRDKVSELMQREQTLLKEKHQLEQEFGQKRAKFKEIYIAREEELKKESEHLQEEVQRIKIELEDVRTVAKVSLLSKQEEFEENKRRFQEELASLQLMMKEAMNQSRDQTAASYQQERMKLISLNADLSQEVQELNNRIAELTSGAAPATASQSDKESVLSSVSQAIRRSVAGAHDKAENLEMSMKKAQKDAELLRAIVMPMEKEIESLKYKLKESQSQLRESQLSLLETKASNTSPVGSLLNLDSGSSTVSSPEKLSSSNKEDLDERVRELNHYLEAEKASRTDLEMYVAVLNTQKNVLQGEADKLRSELHDVCKLLEQEKREHNDLKQTWQMANDQFLESQRLQIMDMKRMQSVLTEEQQRQIHELQKKDQERELQEKRVKMLAQMREKHSQEQEERRAAERRKEEEHQRIQHGTADEVQQSFDNIDRMSPSLMIPTTDAVLADLSQSRVDEHFGESHINEVCTVFQFFGEGGITPEKEETASVVASARARSEPWVSTVGKRLVSEKEWGLLQQEVKSAREKLGRPCDMCTNYEQQLQNMQTVDLEQRDLVHDLKKQLEKLKEKSLLERADRTQLEESLKNAAQDAQQQITSLLAKNQEHESFLTDLRQQYLRSHNEMHDQLKALLDSREQLYEEVEKLRKENDILLAKRSLHSSILKTENFQMPQKVEDLQQLVKKYRRDMISLRVAAEHSDETLRSEIMFLKERVQAEQHTKETIEDTLQSDLDTAREEIAILSSVKDEMVKIEMNKEEAELKCAELQQNLKVTQIQAKDVIRALEKQIEELKIAV
uniref:Rab GTPase-binding effector protein 1-like n=1 Tax=Saccoglossus kowalevskii TaxID=10224 RepID=A0ABM0LU26_SACKO